MKNGKYFLRRNLIIASLLAMFFNFWGAPEASAQYQCADRIYFTSVGNTNVYSYTPGGAITQVSGVSTAGSSAASAVKPDGTRLYSVNNIAPFNLHYNSGGTTNSAGVLTSVGSQTQRNAIAPGGTGYFMEGTASLAGQYYTYTTSGAAPTISGPFNLTVQPSTAPAIVNGGDIAFDVNGIGYLIDQGKNFYRLDFSSNTANFLGNLSGVMDGNPNGLGFITTNTAGQNFLYASTLNNKLYRLDLALMTVNLVTPTSTVAGFSQNDIASCVYPNVVPDVAAIKAWRNITKGDPNTFTASTAASAGDTLEYRVVVRNTGVISAGNSTFQDAIPSGLTYVANTTNLNGASVTDNPGSGNARFFYGSAKTVQGYGQTAGSGVIRVDSTASTLTDNEAVVTFQVTVNNPFDGTANPILNTAQVSYAGPNPGATTTVPSNQTSTPVLVADLQAVKSQRQGTSGAFQTSALTVNQNSTVQYQLLFTNGGSATATNAVLSDTVPSNLTGLSVVSATGASGATACTAAFAASPNQNNLTGNFSGASGATCTVIVQGTASTVGSVTNTARITPANIAVTADPDCSGAPVVCTGNNSSSVSTVISALYSIAGTIFEDVNYAGGSGRTLSASGGVGRGAARVELYNSAGAFVSAVDTIGGSYSFSNLAAGSYTVRVVNLTVTSSRGGASLIGVQTFRTNAGASDAARVGGEDPTKVDAAANTTSASLSSLTTATTTAQSISAVTVSSANIANVDFGFNFDTIVNVNDSGQGSLRQFITNANALSGADTTIFMISDGAAHNGLRAGLTNQLTGGVAVITLASLLPAVSDSNTTIDGTSQTTNVGNTNSGSLGVGGTVGVGNLSLSTVARPEVLITDGATNLQIGLDLQGASETVRGIAIYGFGAAPNSDANANIRLGASASNALVEQNILGATATSFTDTGSATRSVGDNVRSVGADNGVLRNNLIGFSAGKGFGVESGSTGWTIENNEIRGNGIGNSYLDGVDLESAGTTGNTVRGNLVIANEGVGVDSFQSSGSNTIVNNTITGNGVGTSGAVETPGIRIYGANNTVDRNIVNANYGAGVMVNAGASASTITRNSIYANGTILNKSGGAASNQIGIDLQTSTDSIAAGTAPFVTVNDSGDADAGANDLLNFPVLETARVVGGNLVLTGFARPGATIEFFIAAPDASGFGEGQTFLVTLTEGSPQDADATTGTYTSPFRGLTIGTDTTNRFQFTITLPSGVGVGTNLTATATLANATSEFSNVVPVGNAPPAVNLLKSVTPDGVQMPGAELTYTINFSNTGGAAASNFRLTDPDPSNATLRLNTSTDFKVGSVNNSLATTGLTATITYSNDNGATYAYTPVSAGGGAPAGFDRNVTHIRWTFAGSLSPTAPNNAGSVSFVVRIR